MTNDEAIKIAEQECRSRGWPYLEPIIVRQGIWKITVITNANARGSNAIISIRKNGAKVCKAILLPL